MSLQMTTWQTVGPFFRIGLERLFNHDIAGEGVRGQRIQVQGLLLDGDGTPIPDAVVEVWQANAEGKYAHPADTQDKPLEQGFRGFGRIPTDDQGYFRFSTIRPGSVPGNGDTVQAPHFVVRLVMRGLLRGLLTRAYFADEAMNVADPVLAQIPTMRRPTLMMVRAPEDETHYLWTVRMQGPDETVFLDC